MLSGRVWCGLRNAFRKNIPSFVTTEYLVNELRLPSSDGVRSNILAPLTQIGLIDHYGRPTERAIAWIDKNKYGQVCREIIDEIYPDELKRMMSNGAGKRDIISWIELNNDVKESSATKVAYTLFMLYDTSKGRIKRLPRENIEIKNETNGGSSEKTDAEISKDIERNFMIPRNRSNAQKTARTIINININFSPETSVEFLKKLIQSMRDL